MPVTAIVLSILAVSLIAAGLCWVFAARKGGESRSTVRADAVAHEQEQVHEQEHEQEQEQEQEQGQEKEEKCVDHVVRDEEQSELRSVVTNKAVDRVGVAEQAGPPRITSRVTSAAFQSVPGPAGLRTTGAILSFADSAAGFSNRQAGAAGTTLNFARGTTGLSNRQGGAAGATLNFANGTTGFSTTYGGAEATLDFAKFLPEQAVDTAGTSSASNRGGGGGGGGGGRGGGGRGAGATLGFDTNSARSEWSARGASAGGATLGSLDAQKVRSAGTFVVTSFGEKAGATIYKSCQAMTSLYKSIEMQAGRIEKLALLGRGSYAEVYKGRALGVDCAIKAYRSTASAMQRQEAMREIQVSASLDHPCTLRILGWVRKPLQTIMELCCGDLTALYRNKIEGLPFNESRLFQVLHVSTSTSLPR